MLTLKNIEQEIDKVANLSQEISYNFEVNLKSSSYKGDPEIYIKINDKTFYQTKMKGEEKFVIDTILPSNIDCNLIIGLVNKNSDIHTLIKDGKIIEDMNVKVTDIKINNLSLVKKNLFFLDEVKFIKAKNNEILRKIDGCYYNGELVLTLPTPIFPFLSKVYQNKIKQKFQFETLTSLQRNELINAVFD